MVHGEQRGQAAEPGWLGSIERHQERELPVGQAERAEGGIEAARGEARGTLQRKAKAAIPHFEGDGIGEEVRRLPAGLSGLACFRL